MEGKIETFILGFLNNSFQIVIRVLPSFSDWLRRLEPSSSNSLEDYKRYFLRIFICIFIFNESKTLLIHYIFYYHILLYTFQNYVWKSSPLFMSNKIVAICDEFEVKGQGILTGETHIFCRKTNIIFESVKNELKVYHLDIICFHS